MSSNLFHILSVGGESLTNARNGIDIAGNNIANAHTPGFSRQQMRLESKPPAQYGTHVFGSGAKFRGAFRVHDRYLEGQIRDELQSRGFKDSVAKGLARIEDLFNPQLTSTIRDRFASFFNAMRELSNFPDEPATRTAAVDAAENLCMAFRNTHSGVDTIQKDINAELDSEIGKVNAQLQEIARLNIKIHNISAGMDNPPNSLLDQRDGLVREVSETLGASAYLDEMGRMVVRDGNGGLLVDSGNAAQLALVDTEDSNQPQIKILRLGEADMRLGTRDIRGGRVGGLISARDDYAQDIRNELNKLAEGFANSVNEVHRRGFGLGQYGGVSGRNFFHGVGSGEAAAVVEVSEFVRSDPDALGGALTPNSPGDNVIINELVQLGNLELFDGGQSTATQAYDRFVGKLGVSAMRANEDKQAADVVMGQLDAEREKISGVSLDEEAADLLKFQQLFAASSKVITTADELMQTIIGLKR